MTTLIWLGLFSALSFVGGLTYNDEVEQKEPQKVYIVDTI